jgi:hypothetical protein
MTTSGSSLALFITLVLAIEQGGWRWRGGGLCSGPNETGGVRSGVPAPAIAVESASLPKGARELQLGTFDVTDTRPLEVAAALLSRKLGVPIGYEEGPWASTAEVLRAADLPGNPQVWSGPNPRGPRIPRGGTIIFTIPGNSSQGGGAAQVIQAAIDNHRTRKNPGEFRMVSFGESEFSIVADRVENSNGTMVKTLPPLDSIISFPEVERSLGETIDLILKTAAAKAQLQIFQMFVDNNYLRTTRLKLGAKNQLARTVLSAALRRPGGPKQSWSLRFDPESGVYGIGFVNVDREVSIRGSIGLQRLNWPK